MKKVQIIALVAVTLLFSGTSLATRQVLSEINIGTIHMGTIEGTTEGEANRLAQQAPKEKQSLSVQEIAVIQELYPGKFYPNKIIVKKGRPVKIYIITTDEEHINRVSIQPFVSSSELIQTGEVTVIKFTPDRVGKFKIRNIGHGFEGTIIVEE